MDGSPEPRPAPQRRARLHLVYYWLAAFNLITVSVSLGIIVFLASHFGRSVQTNKQWAHRLAICWGLADYAAAVTAPANDAFDPDRDPELEHDRFLAARGRLERAISQVRDTIEGLPLAAADAELLEESFRRIDAAQQAMLASAEGIFVALRSDPIGHPGDAGKQMAEMDGHYYGLIQDLRSLAGQVQAIQQAALEEQEASVRWLPATEVALGGLIFLMVILVTLYGHKLTHQRRRDEQQLARYREHLEGLVQERTARLEESHEQLRLSERLASIGSLAAGLGHDMNNMLFPVRCRLRTLESADLEASVRRELEAVGHSVAYLQRLSDGLRLLALDPEDRDASSDVTHLASWCDEVRPLLETALPGSVALQMAFEADLPPLAVAPHQLAQAVFNLVHNAGKAIESSGTVRVRGEALEDHRVVEVVVSDDGQGMTAEVKRRALDPFFTTRTRGMSTGLGLALVHCIARSAGGQVHIDSAPGQGTTVRLCLPAAETAGVDELKGRASPVAAVRLADPRVSSFVRSLLGSAGFAIDDGANGPGAADLWVTDATDGGLAVARQFLARDGDRRIVVFAGSSDEAASWKSLGAIMVEPSGGWPAIQRALRSVAAPSTERTS